MSRVLPYLGKLKDEWVRDELPSRAGSIAFYAVFSLPAFAMVVVTVAGLFVGAETVRNDLFLQMQIYAGKTTVDLLRAALEVASATKVDSWVGGISVIILVLTAVNVLNHVRSSLNAILQHGTPKKKKTGAVGILWGYTTSFLLMIAASLVLASSLFADTVLTILNSHVTEILTLPIDTIALIKHGITYAALTVLYFLLYMFLPNRRYAPLNIFVSSAVTAALFIAGTVVLTTFISKTNVGAAYGVAASVLILLLWIYYSALIFLLGAELMDTGKAITITRGQTYYMALKRLFKRS